MRRILICVTAAWIASCGASVSDECKDAAVCDLESLPGEFAILTAAPGDGVVVLAWENAAGADRFVVKRGIASGVFDTTVSEEATSPLLDASVTGGTTYYYMVTAVNSAGTRDASVEASATPPIAESLLIR